LGFAEVSKLETLPRHHGDPFDRMLVAHGMEEGAALVTRDPEIANVHVQVFW